MNNSLVAKLLGGRPMNLDTQRAPFNDLVSGRTVRYWRDLLGRRWMAEGRWGLFRVRCDGDDE